MGQVNPHKSICRTYVDCRNKHNLSGWRGASIPEKILNLPGLGLRRRAETISSSEELPAADEATEIIREREGFVTALRGNNAYCKYAMNRYTFEVATNTKLTNLRKRPCSCHPQWLIEIK